MLISKPTGTTQTTQTRHDAPLRGSHSLCCVKFAYKLSHRDGVAAARAADVLSSKFRVAAHIPPIKRPQAGLRTLVRHSQERSHRQVHLGCTGDVFAGPSGDVLFRSRHPRVGPSAGPSVARPRSETALCNRHRRLAIETSGERSDGPSGTRPARSPRLPLLVAVRGRPRSGPGPGPACATGRGRCAGIPCRPYDLVMSVW